MYLVCCWINAIKFTERGDVVLLVGKESETVTHVVVRFDVQDSGIGNGNERLSQQAGATIRAQSGSGALETKGSIARVCRV